MLRRLLALSLSMTLMVTIVAGCGNQAKSGNTAAATSTQAATQSTAVQETAEKVSGDISFFTYRDDLANTYYPDFIKQFNEKYPDVKVTISTSKNFGQDLKVRLASGDVPDVFTNSGVGDGDNLTDEQTRNYLLPVDELPFAKLWTGNDTFKASDGKYYGLTFGSTVVALMYNKKMFNEMGLKAPTTFDEMIEAGKKIKAAGKIGLAFTSKPIWTYVFYSLTAEGMSGDFQAYQKSLLEKDEPFTADDPMVKMMNVVKQIADAKIIEDDTASYDWEPMKRDFAAGNIGMELGQNVLISQVLTGDLKEEDIGIVPFPYDNSKGPYKVTFLPDWGLSISKNSKNLEAAKAFYTFHMDDKYVEYANKTGVLSARSDKTVDYSYVKEFESYPMEKVFKTADISDFVAMTKKIKTDLYQVLAPIGIGTKTPEQQTQMLNELWKKAKAQ